MATTLENANYRWYRGTNLYWIIGIIAALALIAFLSMGDNNNIRTDGYSVPTSNKNITTPTNPNIGIGTDTNPGGATNNMSTTDRNRN